MGSVWSAIKPLIDMRDIRISNHGYDELSADDIKVKDIIKSAPDARVVEEYPDFVKGMAVLVYQNDNEKNHYHVLWGVPRGFNRPAVLITAYRPDPEKWSDDFLRRKK